MKDEIVEEFNEKFATIEEALKYIADSQAKSEFIRKRENAEFNKKLAKIQKLQEQTQKHLDHITKVLRFNIEEYEFQEEKLVEAGKILSRKRKK
jgi:hypothetical protein